MKKNQSFEPSEKLLEKYADLLVNFALGKGKGIKKGDVVRLSGWDSAKPLFVALRKSVIKAGGNPIMNIVFEDDQRHGQSKDLVTYGSNAQLDFFPEKLMKATVDLIDHEIIIIADNPKAFAGTDPEKVMRAFKARAPYMKMRTEKENQGKLTWTLALYGNEHHAKEAGMTLKEYWDQIIYACYLDKKDPISEWKKIFAELERVRAKLTKLKIQKVHVKASDVDLVVGLGSDRKWLAGSGANIPSFEVFCSPDWRQTEGTINFNQPLYYQGNRITGISLTFKKGVIVKFSAKTNEKVLASMLSQPNANKIGEFSLTDGKISRITKFMANTLFDENMGGKFGNTHIAVGNAYRDGYTGNVAKMSEKDWEARGFNTSPVHTDIFSTTDRTVTATLENGKEMIIYKNGSYTV